MRVRQHREEDANHVNREKTVGICPVINAAGQKPIAALGAGYLEYAAKVAQVEWGSPVDQPTVYLWSINVDTDNCRWIGLSPAQVGQYPEEAVVLAGRVDHKRELV